MAELKIKADSGGGTVSFKGPATTTSNAAVQLTLPVDDGTANQYLKTDGSGALSWATVASVGGATGVDFNDSVKTRWGTGNDLEMYHNGTNAQLDNTTGNMELRNVGSFGSERQLQIKAKVDEDSIICKSDGAVELYHDDTKQCETSATGIAFPSGKGIDFSATADSGTTHISSLLADYEEGTWTPVIYYYGGGWHTSNVTTAGGITARYVKVGKLVQYSLKWSGFQHDSGGDHYAKITGLPYSSGEKGFATVTYSQAFTANNEDATAMISSGQLEFYRGTSWLLWSTSSNRQLYLAGSYEANA